MKVLIYTASSLTNPQFGIQMEHAISYAKQGHEVVFCHCAGVMKACTENRNQNKAVCCACKRGFKAGLKNLPNNIRIVGLKSEMSDNNFKWHDFNSVKDIKNYKYKGVDVGFSVMSYIISMSRNPKPAISEAFLNYINRTIGECEHLIDAAETIVKKETPDLIIFFNGRLFDTKPFFNLAINNKINYIATENIGGVRVNEEYKMVDFKNAIPHDSLETYKRCLESWERSRRSEAERIKIGKDFYDRRRSGKKAGDRVYTISQKEGKLPDSFDPNKNNIVVFTSSEDEFSAVSSEVDSLYMFSSQYDGIKYISENINDDDYHIIVRIQPNMKGLDVDYHKQLYKLCELKNVTVVPPEEEVSTYALIDAANSVVVFGSTVGAESLYCGKPVVLLGFAAYYNWGVCSIPKAKEDIVKLIKSPVVYPKAKEIAIKYGYYIMENNLAMSSKFINITPTSTKIMGRQVYAFDYLKICGSKILFKLMTGFYRQILSRLLVNGIVFPEPIRKL